MKVACWEIWMNDFLYGDGESEEMKEKIKEGREKGGKKCEMKNEDEWTSCVY